MQHLLPILLTALIVWSCGSDGGGGSGGRSPQEDPNLGGGSGNQPRNCESAWSAYVNSRPTGLTLKYETTGQGRYEIHTTEVTSSNQNAVSEKFRSSTSGTRESTITAQEYLAACRKNPESTPGQPQSGTLEEMKRETIRVRAGEFATTYVRMRSSLDPESRVTAVSEVWTSDDPYHFLVKQISSTDLSGSRYEVKTELVEAKIP